MFKLIVKSHKLENPTNLSNLVDGISGRNIVPRYETQFGRENEPLFRSAKIPREIATRSGFEVGGEGDLREERSVDPEKKSLRKTEGIRPISSSRVRRWTLGRAKHSVRTVGRILLVNQILCWVGPKVAT